MEGSDKTPKPSSEEKKPSEEPKKPSIGKLFQSHLLNRARKMQTEREDAASTDATKTSENDNPGTSLGIEQIGRRERALAMAKRYEEIMNISKSVDKATARICANANARKVPISKLNVQARKASPSTTRSINNAATSSNAPTTPKKIPTASLSTSTGPRVTTTEDLKTQEREKHGMGIFNIFARSDSQHTDYTDASAPSTEINRRSPRSLNRRVIKEPIFPGKVILGISFFILTVVIFFCQLYLNYITFNGRCLGNMDFSANFKNMPVFSPLGYVGCERSLMSPANSRVLLGDYKGDVGYPVNHVAEGNEDVYTGGTYGPHIRIIDRFGSLNANYLRLYGEHFRMWSAIFMHLDCSHILGNMLCYLQLFYVIEPDWGFWRTLAVYLYAGYGANLFHASMAPCMSCVGASGSLFGLFGSLIPYLVEHWDTLTMPIFLLLESLIFILIELFSTKAGVSTRAHVGGYICGLCFGFMTIKSVAFFDRGAIYHRFALKFFGRFLSDETKQKYNAKITKAAKTEEMARIQYKSKSKANAARFKFLKRFFGIYPYGPYRGRLRDNITRLVFFVLVVAYTAYFYNALYNESYYTKIDASNNMLFSKKCHCCFLRNDGPDQMANLHVSHLHGKFFCFPSAEAKAQYCGVP